MVFLEWHPRTSSHRFFVIGFNEQTGLVAVLPGTGKDVLLHKLRRFKLHRVKPFITVLLALELPKDLIRVVVQYR